MCNVHLYGDGPHALSGAFSGASTTSTVTCQFIQLFINAFVKINDDWIHIVLRSRQKLHTGTYSELLSSGLREQFAWNRKCTHSFLWQWALPLPQHARACCMQWHNHMLLSLIYYGELLKYAWVQLAGYNTTPIVVNTVDSLDKGDHGNFPSKMSCSWRRGRSKSTSRTTELYCWMHFPSFFFSSVMARLKLDLCLLEAICSIHIT